MTVRNRSRNHSLYSAGLEINGLVIKIAVFPLCYHVGPLFPCAVGSSPTWWNPCSLYTVFQWLRSVMRREILTVRPRPLQYIGKVRPSVIRKEIKERERDKRLLYNDYAKKIGNNPTASQSRRARSARKPSSEKELSMESWMLCGRFVPWWSMVNHSWL